MKRYVTKIRGSEHYIYKIGFGTYDILNSGLSNDQIKELLTDFVSMGGNVIDTSMYDIGVRKESVQEAQKLVGEWIKEFKRRQVSCLIGKSSSLLNGNSLRVDLDNTLKNLCTDYIDVFLINGDDEKMEVSSIVDELQKFKDEGKILSYGCSNWKPYRIRQAMEYAHKNNFEGFTVNQTLWNIGSRHMNQFNNDNDFYVKMDNEIMEIHREYDILSMPFNSLANGLFSKLYIYENEEGVINLEDLKKSPYYTDLNLKIYDRMKVIGEKYIASPGWVALGYLFNQDINTCPIVSFRNLTQLREAFEAVDRKYTQEDFKYVDEFEEIFV